MHAKICLAIAIASIAFESTASGPALSNEECGNIYVSVDRVGGKIDDKQTSEFLNAISCSYFSTAEGGEFGSELIMNVLENRPQEFISAFDKLPPLLQETILESIENPIHDGFDIEKIHNNVRKTRTKSTTRSRLLSALELAAGNSGRRINPIP